MHAEVERHQQAAYAPIAIQKWVDRLELDVEKPGLDNRRQPRFFLMHEPLQGIEARIELRRRRRNEERVPGASAPDPVQ